MRKKIKTCGRKGKGAYMNINNIKDQALKSAKKAAKYASTMVEKGKLRLSMSDTEAEISSLLRDIGAIIYTAFAEGEEFEGEIKEKCEAVSAKKEEIAALRIKLSELKGVKNCPSCGSEIDELANFCPKCGESAKEGEWAKI